MVSQIQHFKIRIRMTHQRLPQIVETMPDMKNRCPSFGDGFKLGNYILFGGEIDS